MFLLLVILLLPPPPPPPTGTVVLASGTKVVSYSSRTGDKRWTFDLGEMGVASSLSSDGHVVYCVSMVEQSKLVVSVLNGTNGGVVKTLQLHAPWISSESTR